MKSFQVQQTMWATDWPATRRITRSPTPLPSTPRSHFCPNTPTTHNQPPRQAAAAPPHRKTPSLLRRTPQPSLNTPQCRACPPLPRGWQRTLFPKSSTSERWHRLKPLQRVHMKWPDLKLEPPYSEVVVKPWTIRQYLCTLHRCGLFWKSGLYATFGFGLRIRLNFWGSI